MSQALDERPRAAEQRPPDAQGLLDHPSGPLPQPLRPVPPPVPAPQARRRLRGLDGLRAVAVASVVLFHLDYSLCPGGFLGVDVFFVISGFLITNLLAREALATGRIDRRRFYLRRARRLLPSVLALIGVVALMSATFWRDQLATLRGGALSSLGYVTNWWLVFSHDSYFVATGRPTMFQHLWSLAVEEQYYLVWGVVVAALTGSAWALRRFGGTAAGVRRIVVVALVLSAASTLWMAIDAVTQNLPYDASTSPAYYGSGTHTMGLFLGSAAGAAFALRRHQWRPRPAVSGVLTRPLVTDLVGLAALGVVCYEFFAVDEYRPGLYRGGFLAFDAAVLVTILCAVRRGAIFGRLLDIRPIRWLGRRSYSIYVWHWPIIVVTRPGLDLYGSVFWLNLARLLLILAVSALAYRFVEVPLRTADWRSVRAGAIRRWTDRSRRSGTWTGAPRSARPGSPDSRQRHSARLWTVGAAATSGVAVVALLLAAGPPRAAWLPPRATPLAGIDAGIGGHAAAGSTAGTGARPDRRTQQQTGGQTPNPKNNPTGLSADPSTHPTVTGAAGELTISAFGDSVLLGARVPLAQATRALHLDAVEGRQADDVLDDVAAQARAGRLAPDVLIHVGDNGIIDPTQLRDTLALLRDRARVVLLTVRVPRDWEGPNNATIRAAAAQFPNVRLVDWQALSADHLRDWIYGDGLHLTPAGARAYTRIVLAAFRAR